MNKKIAITAGGPLDLPYTPAIRYGDTIYVSGQVGTDEKGNAADGIEKQTELAIENARTIIEAAGSSLDNVLMCRCFLQKIEDFAGMNKAYSKYFGGGKNIAPARYTVVAPLAAPEFLVEIAMIVGI